MRYFIVEDRIAKKTSKFYNFSEAKEEAEKIMRVYIQLNSRVTCKEIDGNFYIYLKDA